jgi:spore photoproduct lyase
MYRLSPPAIYVFDRALADERSAARVQAMLGGLGRDLSSIEHVTDADIPELIHSQQWENARLRQGMHGEHEQPALVFATLRTREAVEVGSVLEKCPPGTPSSLVAQLLGSGGQMVHHEPPDSGRVCRSRVQFDTIYGCPHGCKYCTGGKVAAVFVNLEEFIEREVMPLSAANPWQKVFMFNSCLTDTLCFEPEYGMSELLATYYASTSDQHYLVHTKSANVDFLLDLNRRSHTIILWSMTSETASRAIEPGSATMEERVEAARKCQQAGYTVRYKFKPIVPLANWREECERMMDLAFAKTRPENIGLCMVAWMSAEELESIIDVSLLDPDFVRAMRESAEEMRGFLPGPFPHEVRAEVYSFYLEEIRKHDESVPVFLCTESAEMWREFEGRLGRSPGNYVCGCGPQSAPGATRLKYVGEPTGVR